MLSPSARSNNISNEGNSKFLDNLELSKNFAKTINNIDNENDYFNIKNTTANQFFVKGQNIPHSPPEKSFLNKSIKVNGNTLDIIESDNNISSLIKDINFNNLNEYYELQTSIFMKKIEKLNLKFYWTCEVLLNDKNIQYPYNKLFLILFKEISLYIDEIERLNK